MPVIEGPRCPTGRVVEDSLAQSLLHFEPIGNLNVYCKQNPHDFHSLTAARISATTSASHLAYLCCAAHGNVADVHVVAAVISICGHALFPASRSNNHYCPVAQLIKQ